VAAADEAEVGQVLVNLTTNAGEAVEGRDGLVTVRTGEYYFDPAERPRWEFDANLEAGWYPMIMVSDDGHGMPAEVLGRVFDPFFTTKFPGRGLGLPAVLGIVRNHRGAIRITSEPDGGTTVTVLFQPLEDGRPRKRPSHTGSRAQLAGIA
jgi:signal transduction histidine kinase